MEKATDYTEPDEDIKPIPGLDELLNVPVEFVYNGEKIQLKELSLVGQARFSQWLKNNAKMEIERSTDLSEEVKDRYRAALTRDIAAGKYAFNSELAVEALHTPEGAAYALYLGIYEVDPSIEEHEARRIFYEKLNEMSKRVYQEIIKYPKVSSPSSSPHGKQQSQKSRKQRGRGRKK